MRLLSIISPNHPKNERTESHDGNVTDALLVDVEPAVVRRSVAEVLASVADLNPAVIYLYHADVARY